ncbi:DUF3997 domain-containing protein [Alkalicoccobacillus plakortidis]|uniref:DUF3997 domain-containing protein n=1 Tax=Alkalicoccobacillus plakortidis TaxID=444060 RepID=A0ABT0XEF2_9BACI|nr:DUF3997 domain-containing protein [Alkalicoccobacillus plakortidis]MCM2674110.1 DUF3997 domain-containing protein [Alkalicoccobacillus plakortidis]
MDKIRFFIIILFLMIISGCAGMQNSSYDLSDGYSVMYTSAHQAKIIYDETGENTSGEIIVPAKVIRVNQDENYIIAEQEKLDSDGKPNGTFTYFIEDKSNRSLEGARLTEDEFNRLKSELGIELELLKVTEFPEID